MTAQLLALIAAYLRLPPGDADALQLIERLAEEASRRCFSWAEIGLWDSRARAAVEVAWRALAMKGERACSQA